MELGADSSVGWNLGGGVLACRNVKNSSSIGGSPHEYLSPPPTEPAGMLAFPWLQVGDAPSPAQGSRSQAGFDEEGSRTLPEDLTGH